MSSAKVTTEYGLKLTLTNPATIKVKATKKENGSATAIKLLNSEGAQAGITSGIDNIVSTENPVSSLTEYTINVTSAGSYYIGADANGMLLYSLVIDY